jgi:hypothetical protein
MNRRSLLQSPSLRFALVGLVAFAAFSCATIVGFPDLPNLEDGGADGAGQDSGPIVGEDATTDDASPSTEDAGTPDDARVPPEDASNGTGDGSTGGGDGGKDAGPPLDGSSGLDAGIDATIDAGHDAGIDAGHDAGIDAGFDAGHDAGFDAGHDAGPKDAGVDTGPTCAAPSVLCSGICVSTATSGANCGACGHSCGDGTLACAAGICQPVPVFTGSPVVGLAIDNGNIFVHVETASSSGIDECAVGGCASATHLTTSTNSGLYNPPVTAAGGHLGVTFAATGADALALCAESSCSFITLVPGPGEAADVKGWVASGTYLAYDEATAFGEVVVANQLAADGGATEIFVQGSGAPDNSPRAAGPLALDGTSFAFVLKPSSGSPSVEACSIASKCATPQAITTEIPTYLNVLNGTLYMAGAPPNAQTVTTCPVTGCAALTSFVTSSAPIEQTAVDSSGFYWLDSAGSIWTCPLGGCKLTGINVLNATTERAASVFAVYNGFVYFAGTGSSNTTVYKVAVP